MRFRAWLLYTHAEAVAWEAFWMSQEPKWASDEDSVYYGPGAVLRAMPWRLRWGKETHDNGVEYWRLYYPHFGDHGFRTYGKTELEAVLDMAEAAPSFIRWAQENNECPFEEGLDWAAQWEWHYRALAYVAVRPLMNLLRWPGKT